MDFRDRSIITQVAFKGAVDICHDLDLTTMEGTSEFESVFTFLVNSLFDQIGDPEERAAQVIQAHFPGAVQVGSQGTSNPAVINTPAAVLGYQNPQPQLQGPMPAYNNGTLAIKGTQHGELPQWLIEQAAAKGVTEVYDNRDRVGTSKRPWFKATTARPGEDPAAFWPPR